MGLLPGLAACLSVLAAAAPLRTVVVDPRAELMAGVHLIARPDDPAFSAEGSPYGAALIERLSAHRSHPAFAAYSDLVACGVDAQTALSVAYLALDRATLRPRALPEFGHPRCAGQAAAYVSALSDLAARSDFAASFAADGERFRDYEAELDWQAQTYGFRRKLEAYAGEKIGMPRVLVACPLFYGQASVMTSESGKTVSTSFIGVAGWRDARPKFAYFELAQEIFQEFAHGLIDPLGSESQEAMARAVAARVHEKEFGSRRRLTTPDPKRDKAMQALLEFEAHRDAYPTLTRFYPKLAAAVAAAADFPALRTVKVDPRAELLAAVHLLAFTEKEDGGFSAEGSPYGSALRAHVLPHRDHPAIPAYRALIGCGVDPKTAISVMYGSLTEDLAPETQVPVFGRRRCSPQAAKLAAELADFARASRFKEFFASRREEFKEYERELDRQCEAAGYRRALESYAGEPISTRRVLVFSPLFRRDDAIFMDRPPQDPISVAFVGVSAWKDGKPVIRYPELSRSVWQELAHGLLDGLGDVGRESIARGVAQRLYQRTHGKLDDSAPDPRADRVRAALLDYERQRAKFPRLTLFYPELAKAVGKD